MIERWTEDQLFNGIDYSAQKLTHTEFDGCKFQNCDFSNSDLTESDFINCSFENCNFSNAKISGAGMKEVLFTGCKLIGNHFETCSDFLFSVNFKNCSLDYSSFFRKKMKKAKFDNCSLKEVDFSETDLSAAEFHACDLTQTVFENSILEKTDFRSAYNFSIDPDKNKIKKARFSTSGLAGLLEKYKLDIE
ncbi:MAG: pentapeptide repeat-containing protein [Prolixibacteraceae bacterium]|jgi:uncharacterized protein YjbI with pentapeptide repeats